MIEDLPFIVESQLYKIDDWSPARSSWCCRGCCSSTGNICDVLLLGRTVCFLCLMRDARLSSCAFVE